MRRCYHQRCDYAGNPDLHPGHAHFLSKTAQAVALATADLAEGLDRCDLSHLLKPEEKLALPRKLPEKKTPSPADVQKPVLERPAMEKTSSAEILSALSALLQQIKGVEATPLAKLPVKDEPAQMPISGPYQPNYGNQYNIGQLTVNVASSPQAVHPPLLHVNRLLAMLRDQHLGAKANSPMLIKFTER